MSIEDLPAPEDVLEVERRYGKLPPGASAEDLALWYRRAEDAMKVRIAAGQEPEPDYLDYLILLPEPEDIEEAERTYRKLPPNPSMEEVSDWYGWVRLAALARRCALKDNNGCCCVYVQL